MNIEDEMILDDGFGNQWEKCGHTCALEIVRPGKVQCGAENCPFDTASLQFAAHSPEGNK